MDLVRAGNDAAFEAIVSRYRRPLLRYCSGFMPEARAEDAVQTAFLRALGSLRCTHGELNLKPWLYRIAHNTALNALRDRSLQHEELSEEIDGVERPDQAYEKNERLRDVVAAVSALPERQRDAVVLRELEGRSYEEIAAELGVSNGSVRQLLNRARVTLRTGMTALTPYGLLARLPWGAAPGEAMTTRVAELCAGGAGAASLTKVCASALVTGAVMGGVAGSPPGGIEAGRAKTDGRAAPGRVVQPDPPVRGQTPAGVAASDGEDRSGAEPSGNSGPSSGPEHHSGPQQESRRADDRSGRGEREERQDDGRREPEDDRRETGEDRSGGEEDDNGHSGPGGGGDDGTFREEREHSGSGRRGVPDSPEEVPDPLDEQSSGPSRSDEESGGPGDSSGSGSSGSGSGDAADHPPPPPD